MHLSTLLLGAALIFTQALSMTLGRPPCTPHEDHMTCVLYWTTNTGVVIDMTNPYDFEAWARATIYSPACTHWGYTKDGLSKDVKLWAWGLDHSDPLILNPEHVDGLSYNTPLFRYRGKTWGHKDCDCKMGSLLERTHICTCPFKCMSVPIIG